VRQNGWIGGVCGGVAARLGIDPIIVRGIAVVIAVLGGPALLLYAAAWLLLPDAYGDIHLQRLLKGHFDPPIIAIIVIALLSLLPFAQGFWWTGAQFWSGLSWFPSAGRVLWTVLVIALVVAVIVWAARSGRVPPAPPHRSSTSPTDAGGGAAHSASASTAPASTPSASTHPQPAESQPAESQPTEDTVPPATTPPATTPRDTTPPATTPQDGDLADWRARQDAWRADYAAWTAQRDDARAVRQQRSAEMRTQAQALAAEAEEARRRRRGANPRTSAAYVFIALGAALVAGGVAAAIALVGDASGFALAIALAVATGVIGLAIVTAGILRRRSGFLTFVSIVLVLCTIGAALPPRGHDLTLLPRATYWNTQHVSVYQPVGDLDLYYDEAGSRRADIVQGAGAIMVQLQHGVSARVEIVQHTPGSSVHARRYDDQGEAHAVAATSRSAGGTRTYLFGGSSPEVSVRIEQGAGDVDVLYYPAAK
jgi:phage shock protein PspC (stress-responsive transcriptional regulator)